MDNNKRPFWVKGGLFYWPVNKMKIAEKINKHFDSKWFRYLSFFCIGSIFERLVEAIVKAIASLL